MGAPYYGRPALEDREGGKTSKGEARQWGHPTHGGGLGPPRWGSFILGGRPEEALEPRIRRHGFARRDADESEAAREKSQPEGP